MAKNKVKAQPKGQKGKPRQQAKKQGVVASPDFARYDRLVRDPCAGNFARPPYAGGSSGYMVRLTTALSPTVFSGVSTVGTATTSNFSYEIQPGAFPAYGFAGATSTTASPVWGISSVSGTFLSNPLVKEFRCVAACAKWVPTGPISERAGMISLGYVPGIVKNTGESSTPADLLLIAQNGIERAPNGSSDHEIRWLPTPTDETYTQPQTSTLYVTSGTMTVTGVGVDSRYTATNIVTPNGYVEVTLVVEWTPTGSTGLSLAPETNVSFTSQDYQSTIKDVGRFLLTGARTVGMNMGAGMARGATQMVYQAVAGVSSRRRYAISQPGY